jgi:PAS domain S-box-containing protein
LAARINCSTAPSTSPGLRKLYPKRHGRWQSRNGRLAKLAVVLTTCSLLSQFTAAAPVREVKRVLLLHSLGFSSPASILVDREIRAALENSPYQIELYSESMQNILFSDPTSQRIIREGYISKYRDRRPDVVIAIAPNPIRFMAASHQEFGANTPVVICASSQDQLGNLKLDSRFTGAWRTVESAKTLEAALQLLPATRHVVVVGGGVYWYDRDLEAIVRKQLQSYESRFEFTYLSNLEMPVLLEKLKQLPEHSIVLYTAISQDAAGTHFIDETQSLPLVVGAANAPVFVMEDTFLGQGTIGGYVTSYGEEGRAAGQTAVRLLRGEKAHDIPIVNDANVYMFDWRALHRWGVNETALPPGSVVLERQPTAWESYKRYIVGTIFVVLAETLLVLGLLWQRAKRRKVERALVERLRFESLLSDLSTTFIDLPEERVDSNIENGLGRIAEFLQIEGVTLYEFSANKADLTATFTCLRDGINPGPKVVRMNEVPWWANHLLRGEEILASDPKEFPEEASIEKERFQKRSLESAASIPLKIGGEIVGAMALVSTKRRVVWTEDLVKQLRVLAEVFSNALTRKRSSEALLDSITELKRAEAVVRESEKRFRLVADTAPVLIWMAGTDKLCTYFNKPWLDFTGRSLNQEFGNGWAEGVHSEDLQRCMDTYSQAFDRREGFSMEYRLRRHDGEYRWILDIGVPRFNQERSFVGYIGTCLDLTDRKQAEEALRESEVRFQLAAQAGNMFAYEWDAVTDVIVRSAESVQILGIDESEQLTGQKVLAKVHPDDREELLAAVHALSPEAPDLQVSYRLVRPDGSEFWVERNSRAHFDQHGRLLRVVGMVADITERKLVELALANVRRQLIEAQEVERTRIARELHDDIGQRLALLAVELEQLRQDSADLPAEIRNRVSGLQRSTTAIATDIQSLSHELHSSKLDYLGVVAAMRGFCQEFGEQTKVKVDFKSHDVPSHLSRDVSLCLFRVLQESLHNSAKHSGARHVEVQLWGTPEGIHLAVSDSGAGFDRLGVKENRGLGLISMEERLKLLKGALSIESQPKRGTTIHARVPLRLGSDSVRAAG